MAKYVLVVPSAAQPGQDDAYNAWYDTTHLADLLAIPGVISGRRFEPAEFSPNPPPATYLAIYEIETDNPAAIFEEMMRKSQSGEMQVSDALDQSSAQLWLYKQR